MKKRIEKEKRKRTCRIINETKLRKSFTIQEISFITLLPKLIGRLEPEIPKTQFVVYHSRARLDRRKYGIRERGFT